MMSKKYELPVSVSTDYLQLLTVCGLRKYDTVVATNVVISSHAVISAAARAAPHSTLEKLTTLSQTP